MLSLTSRQTFVLNRVVETYIETAQPVPSRAVADTMPVSSATVRHEMGVLEETGYLVQAHHSAGRVPTDRGFRHYVDYGREDKPVCRLPVQQLSSRLQNRVHSVQDMPFFGEQAAAMLSEFSREMGVLLVPDEGEARTQVTAQGLGYLLEKPECRDASKLRPLVRLVEEKKRLREWMDAHAVQDRPQAFIGSEHEFEELTDYAIVTARYQTGLGSGAVAVIGLKRMDYFKVLPVVAGMTGFIETTLETLRKN